MGLSRLVGFVEMYTPEFLASQVPDLPPSSASVLQPYVANLAVIAGARKQGVASALMDACEQVSMYVRVHIPILSRCLFQISLAMWSSC